MGFASYRLCPGLTGAGRVGCSLAAPRCPCLFNGPPMGPQAEPEGQVQGTWALRSRQLLTAPRGVVLGLPASLSGTWSPWVSSAGPCCAERPWRGHPGRHVLRNQRNHLGLVSWRRHRSPFSTAAAILLTEAWRCSPVPATAHPLPGQGRRVLVQTRRRAAVGPSQGRPCPPRPGNAAAFFSIARVRRARFPRGVTEAWRRA